MQKLKFWIIAIVFAAGVGGVSATLASPQMVSADTDEESNASCEGRLLTMPAWYRGLTDSNCNIVYPGDNTQASNEARNTLSSFIWTIGLNVVEILLHVVGYAAVGFVIYGGFTYLISTGQPDKLSSAKNTITNALIGLVISIFAIAIVNIVVGIF